MRGSFSDWFVGDRGSDSQRCAARSVIGLLVSGVIGGHVTLTGARGSFSDWFVRVWCDRGSCDSHRCVARSVIGLFVSGVIEGHVTLTGAWLVQ